MLLPERLTDTPMTFDGRKLYWEDRANDAGFTSRYEERASVRIIVRSSSASVGFGLARGFRFGSRQNYESFPWQPTGAIYGILIDLLRLASISKSRYSP
jgi:hypothetical protein